VSSVLIGVLTGYTVAAVTHFAVVGVLAFVSFVSCAIMIMLTSLVKSSAALGVMTGLSGTFLGFLCGIYMPYSSLGKGMEVAGSVLPFTHLTIWLKHIVLGDAFRQLGVTGELEAAMNELFSANSTGFLGLNAPLWMMELYAAAFAVICLATAWALIQRRAAHRPRGSRAA
jgi:hypothetical protein